MFPLCFVARLQRAATVRRAVRENVRSLRGAPAGPLHKLFYTMIHLACTSLLYTGHPARQLAAVLLLQRGRQPKHCAASARTQRPDRILAR